MRRALLTGLVLWLLACGSAPKAPDLPIPAAWTTSDLSHTLDAAELCKRIQCRERQAADVRIVTTATGSKLVRKIDGVDKELTPDFLAIDSFDVSAERKEVIFSAKRKDNFDIGLVSIDGSDIHWVPEDGGDETNVMWAMPGHKAIYQLATPVGDAVRAVHIPTASQLTTVLQWTRIRAMAWEPGAQRISMILTGSDASERIESMRYGGEERRVDVAPDRRAAGLAAQPFAGGVMLRPEVARYHNRWPLVVWVGDPLQWDDSRWPLLKEGGLAVVITRRPPDAAFWAAVAEEKSLEPRHVWVVGVRGNPEGEPEGVTWIAPSPALSAGRYRREGRVLLVPPASVQSVAAGFIEDQLKGTTPRNGSHR
jgi:hypothetical protein